MTNSCSIREVRTCFNCQKKLIAEPINSVVNDIPSGLDRNFEVTIFHKRCNTCGCITIDELTTSKPQLYVDEATCFEASKDTIQNTVFPDPYSSPLFSSNALMKMANGRICDFGCGAGYATKKLLDINPNTFGIDIDKRAVEFSQSIGLPVSYGDLSTLQELEFEHFVAIGVLEHFPNPNDLLKIVTKKVSKPGGIVYLAFPNITAWTYYLSLYSDQPWDMLCEPGHYSFYSKKALVDYFKEKNFRLNGMHTCSHIGRGKSFSSRTRSAKRERIRVKKIVESRWQKRFYQLLPKLLDQFNLGDISVYEFVKN